MRFAFILAVATCLTQINQGAIITTNNEGMYEHAYLITKCIGRKMISFQKKSQVFFDILTEPLLVQKQMIPQGSTLDAVGSSQISFPTQNLERTH